MTETTQDPSSEKVFSQLVNAGADRRDKAATEMAQRLFSAGRWIASQRDPQAQFEKIITTASRIHERDIEVARRQFLRTFDPSIGNTEASSAFDLLVGLFLYSKDPSKFKQMLLDAQMSQMVHNSNFIQKDTSYTPIKDLLTQTMDKNYANPPVNNKPKGAKGSEWFDFYKFLKKLNNPNEIKYLENNNNKDLLNIKIKSKITQDYLLFVYSYLRRNKPAHQET